MEIKLNGILDWLYQKFPTRILIADKRGNEIIRLVPFEGLEGLINTGYSDSTITRIDETRQSGARRT